MEYNIPFIVLKFPIKESNMKSLMKIIRLILGILGLSSKASAKKKAAVKKQPLLINKSTLIN